MNDIEFLRWIAYRFINVYDESPNVDFVLRLRHIAQQMEDEMELQAKERRRAREIRDGF